MIARSLLLLVVSFWALTDFTAATAQEPVKGQEPAKSQDAAKVEAQEPISVVHASVLIAGQKVDYKVTTGRLPVKDMTGKAGAKIFYMAYTRKTNMPVANRPLTFCFNGGPGSASLFVHLGVFGPRRVLIDEDGKTVPQPYKLVDNEYSLLDVTDLVFIDPVSTGFSRSDDPKEAKLFHGLEEDTSSVGDFIKAYVTKNERGDSPVFIAGESYGTTRSASLSDYVQKKGGVKLAGIGLISMVLDFETILFGNNDMPYALYLPTYTAAAHHHKKLGEGLRGDLVTVLDEAQQFANGPYLLALRKGNLLTDDERRDIAKKTARYTGLSEELILKLDLRIEAGRFRTELLKDQQEVIGRYDARVKAKTGKGGGGKGGGGGDPSNALLSPAFGDLIKSYLANELEYKTELKYTTTGQVQPWSYGKAGNNRFANVAPRLKAAMDRDTKLRVFVASGYMDLATPYSGTQYTFAHIGPRALRDRITMEYYPAGHMMYSHQPSLRKFRDDFAKFILNRDHAVNGTGYPQLSWNLVPAFSPVR